MLSLEGDTQDGANYYFDSLILPRDFSIFRLLLLLFRLLLGLFDSALAPTIDFYLFRLLHPVSGPPAFLTIANDYYNRTF
jgi:hypothetical protein